MRQRVRLGDLLVQNGVISSEQLATALATQKRKGLKLGRTLIELGYLSDDDSLQFLSRQLSIPLIDLDRFRYRPEVVHKLPETHARRFRAIVLEEGEDDYLVGMADPTDIFAYDELVRLLRRPVRQAVVRESELLRTVDLVRSEEHTSELQSRGHLVCRLLLEKKK